MQKQIGMFKISVGDSYPVRCFIENVGGEIGFNHTDIEDLEHAIKEIKKAAYNALPKHDKTEVTLNAT